MFKQLNMINKDKPMILYKPGGFMYLRSSQASLCKTSSEKFRVIYIELTVVHKIIHTFQYILVDIKSDVI